MNTKSQQAKLIKNVDDMQNINGVKLVKNAIVFQKNDVYFCRHYDTIIFAYKPKTKQIEIDADCSPTSNRQIDNLMEFFHLDPSKAINVHDGEKWNFSGERI